MQKRLYPEKSTLIRGYNKGTSSPLLFSIYIADLVTTIQDTACNVNFFADDTVIGSRVIDDIHNTMYNLSAYCAKNVLEVNTDKTKFMKFRPGGRLGDTEKIYYRGELIDSVSEFLYLGILLSSTVSIASQLNHLKLKCTKATNSLRSKVDFHKINFQSAYRLLEAVVKPVATYDVSVFASPENQESIENHYRSFIGRYWKRWANISKFHKNRQFLKHLYEDDFLCIQNAKPCNRRPFALFYANGLHQLKRSTEGCYSQEESSTCVCKLCNNPIFGKFHLFSSKAMQPGNEREKNTMALP